MKRLLQICGEQNPTFICGALILLSEVIKVKPDALRLRQIAEVYIFTASISDHHSVKASLLKIVYRSDNFLFCVHKPTFEYLSNYSNGRVGRKMKMMTNILKICQMRMKRIQNMMLIQIRMPMIHRSLKQPLGYIG